MEQLAREEAMLKTMQEKYENKSEKSSSDGKISIQSYLNIN